MRDIKGWGPVSRRLAWLGVLAVLTSVCATMGLGRSEASWTRTSAPQDSLRLGDDAPAFVMDNLATGEPVFLSDFAGRTLRQPWKNSPREVVVLCFWASWSEPCEKEITEISTVAAAFSGKPVRFFLVNTAERAGTSAEVIKSTVAQRAYKIPVLIDGTGTVADRYGVQTMPATVVIDKYAVLRLLHYGPGSAAGGNLEKLLTALSHES